MKTPHGCEECRSHRKRQDLANEMLSTGTLGEAKVQCPDCGALWKAETYVKKGDVFFRITPIPPS